MKILSALTLMAALFLTTGCYGEEGPPVAIREDAESLFVDVSVPGFTRDQIEVTVDGQTLNLVAKKTSDKAGDGTTAEVVLTHDLPEGVDPSSASAELRNGVLHLTFRKKEGFTGRRVEISPPNPPTPILGDTSE